MRWKSISHWLVWINTALLLLINFEIIQNQWHLNNQFALELAIDSGLDIVLIVIELWHHDQPS